MTMIGEPPLDPKDQGQKQSARLVGIGSFVKYPIGRADIEFRLVGPQGQTGSKLHTLQLIVTDDEARQLAEFFSGLALQLQREGGTKQ